MPDFLAPVGVVGVDGVALASSWAWEKLGEKEGMGTSLSGWTCSYCEVRFLYLRSLQGVNTSTEPFSLQ